ncbi:MAG: hypothetical protein J7L71_11555, partial [Spirochaetaceae bacterium]|nr:hypothetical protein [Spirochaetaceae bacterium]
DYIFPDYLFTILEMEKDSYQPGVRTVLTSGSDNTGFQFEKAFLLETDDGNKWWRYHITANGNDLLIEVLANSYGVPLKIRFADSSTGMHYEKIPDIALDFARAKTEAPSEQLAASIAEKISKDIDEGFSNGFNNPVIVGEEPVTTPAGMFMAVHVKDYKSESENTNYWLSPDIPGGIIKISVSDTSGNESSITELSEITTLSRPVISGNSISIYSNNNTSGFDNNYSEPGYSEGTQESPVLINADEDYYGSVSDKGTSYYKIINNKRSDLFIEISGLKGIAELIYFGTDSKFDNWTTSSEGSSLNVEDYMLSSGSTVYFTVHDIADEYSVGEHYSIYINQNPILDPVGIMIKGDIYEKAVELTSGKSYNLDAGNEGLDYYKTTIKKGSTLKITVLKEPEAGRLIWFDTGNGIYSSMFTEEKNNGRQITIDGLKPGTICYYYFTSDMSLSDPLQKLELKITEK